MFETAADIYDDIDVYDNDGCFSSSVVFSFDVDHNFLRSVGLRLKQ